MPGTGIEVRVHPGTAIAGGTWRVWSRVASVPVSPATTETIWQLASGLYEVGSTPPESSALPLWEVETDATGVAALRDRRSWAEGRRLVVLRGQPASGPTIGWYVVSDTELRIERVIQWVSDGGGPAGASKYDIRINGQTIYPGYATDDQRPTFPYDVSGPDLIHDSGIPEVRILRYGDVVTWLVVQTASGGLPALAELNLVCSWP
ncbi:MAG: hypothetical protein GY856_24435 [bacterium]|nr:hypothetical protein [bacterium]